MEIHLIRHTAVDNPENLCYGFAEIPLRQDYFEDLKSLNLDDGFDLVISSPAQRCCQMAEYFKFDYKTDERLREMNFGNWELRKWTEISEEEINPWYKDFVNVKASGGENLLEMQTRVISFWNELLRRKKAEKILIITHAGVIRLIFQAILQFPLENIFTITIDYGKKAIIRVEENVFSIKNINV
ncbi:alpha-ribazole phosphatase [Chryseobacterium phosphatilyticum]|uniref:Alpha-ribazole phosphatase n=1 Tax=Chryseobacterium phosphatilyticum TaxID=475075 RepID=A0A316X9Q1_9FLAO|nr:alpha-ribazole phosphatase family protein [Chryseobacterium phosphatilyticum]PWN69013.1 alpha-ribazole phosphatase [Chryseobacterium phosphatilyticum]